MPHISIISSSVRTGRNSHRVALYIQKYFKENNLGTTEILDLKEYNFPVFDNPLKFQKNPTQAVREFAEKVKLSDGIIIVTPEYNGGFPASLKNAVDLLLEEWHRKPIAISTVSSGVFGGSQALVSLQFSLWKIGAWTVTSTFPVPKVQDAYDEAGNAIDKIATDKLSKIFIKEFLWCVELNKLKP